MAGRSRKPDAYRIEAEGLIDRLSEGGSELDRRLAADMIRTAVRLLDDGCDTGQMKMMTNALREMRSSWRVFADYRGIRKVSIYGSARTPEDHPDYQAARDFSRLMAEHAWMAITGAGDGIMKAGHEGPTRDASFGLRIRLPFETAANEVIEGDPKLISFRYFFTRKVMFMAHADAVTVFPGGFGTQDELFEALTLIQTGKSNLIPIVLLEGTDGVYWEHWENYIEKSLGDNGWISPEDFSLIYRASSPEDACSHILNFYRGYHSKRYVGDHLVIRLRHALEPAHLDELNTEFSDLVHTGAIEQSAALPEESDHLDLPRIMFHHHRRGWARVRQMIDRINEMSPGSESE
ncbi:MAG: LOG family protein [Phycisphaerales bacterium]|nr:LOG family protein [Phycisphaerales bacterium]